jgi:hypothetical protein
MGARTWMQNARRPGAVREIHGPIREYEAANREPPMILAFRIPDSPYSDRVFSALHKAFDVVDGVHATLEIFGVELTGLLGAALPVLAPVAAIFANFLALGAGYAQARADIAKNRMTWGFAQGVVTGADRRRWADVKSVYWKNAPEGNAFDEGAGRIATKAYNLGLACGFVQGRKLTSRTATRSPKEKFFWKSIDATLSPLDLAPFDGDTRAWSSRTWDDWYILVAARFIKLYVKE